MSDNDDEEDDDDASTGGGGSTAEEDNSTSDGAGGGASTTSASGTVTNAVTALIQNENKWLVKARLSMVVMIVLLTIITAVGVNQFMKYVEFQDFTTRVRTQYFFLFPSLFFWVSLCCCCCCCCCAHVTSYPTKADSNLTLFFFSSQHPPFLVHPHPPPAPDILF